MNRHERGLEFKVGVFVFVGCAALAGLVVKFGRLGEGVKTYYQLTVRFADASGLLKGSDVLLAGAKIGRVAQVPFVRGGRLRGLPLLFGKWTRTRDLPPVAARTFSERWKDLERP